MFLQRRAHFPLRLFCWLVWCKVFVVVFGICVYLLYDEHADPFLHIYFTIVIQHNIETNWSKQAIDRIYKSSMRLGEIVYAHVCLYMCIYIGTYMHLCVYVPMCLCAYVCQCASVYVWA